MSLPAAGAELPYLAAFHAVCREGGFTAAARRLECSQPAVSYQMRALERVLRTRLIERGGRQVLLTPAGQRLQSFCDRFFGELEALRHEPGREGQRDPLRLGAASGFGRYVLFPALHRLRTERPGLEVQLAFDAADVIVDRLLEGAIEAAFVYTRRISNRLRHEAVYDEELLLIAPPSLRGQLRKRGATRPAGLSGMPFVTYQEGDYVFGRWFDVMFEDQPPALTSAARFSELEEVIDFVRRGVGLSIVPRDAAEAELARRRIVGIYPVRGKRCSNQVFMVTRAGSEIRPELRQLAGLLAPPRDAPVHLQRTDRDAYRTGRYHPSGAERTAWEDRATEMDRVRTRSRRSPTKVGAGRRGGRHAT